MIKILEPSICDLNIMGISHGDLVKRQIRNVVIAVGAALALSLMMIWALGRVHPAPMFLAVSVGSVVAWLIPLADVRRESARRRVDMDLTVSVYLDLVNVLVAGGAGIETAMLAAASVGDGESFQRVRFALAAARGTRGSYWDILRELGADLGVSSLQDVANSVQLAGEHGARIRLTLAAKARALRSSNLARVEHDAQQRTELMGLPVVLMFLGFVLLIGYPAFVSTIGVL